MGSSFIAYGLLLLMMLKLGQPFLKRRNWSQESIDSFVIMFFGIVTTFTMHNFISGNNDEWNRSSNLYSFSTFLF